MRNIDITGDMQRRARADAARVGEPEEFTPANFFKEAGTVIAVCLALALLAQLLLG